ncbi:DUF835 domain-containing protein [Methanococcoides orientis]|uniref:DUF835 domain-containing protein n=1 Tax=Methanococcoides orientis TaxID=2822137 RepID=UPI001E540F96|nr:DUF835 domain-containing protein [Methanococcoides orientis]UGV41235.1 DUF835 domain-containing protein [Methanococcoides orientis]
MTNDLPKILVVDDESTNLEVMEAYLSSDYEIAMATSGKEALEQVKQFQPDIILLDILMPIMDGFQTCKLLKTDEETKFIPIILVTALSEKEDRIKGIEAGADEFLTKPINILELKSRIRSLLKLKHQHDLLLEERDTAQKYLNIAGVLILVLDNDQNIIEINNKGTHVLECTREEIIGLNWYNNFIPEEYRTESKERFNNLVKDSSRDVGDIPEKTIMTRKGNEKILSWSAIKLKDKNGKTYGILCSGEDITLQKNVENNLKKANEHLDLLIKMSPIATIVINEENKILKANESVAELLGFEINDMLHTPMSKLVLDNQNIEFTDKKDMIIGFLKKNGDSIDLNVSTSLIKKNDDEKELIINLQNISELRGLLIDPSLEKPSLEESGDISDLPKLESGYTYIQHEDDNMGTYEIFSKMVKQGNPGLCITRENPAKIREKYNIQKTPIVWLTKNKSSESPSIAPSEIFKLHPTIENFMKKAQEGIILVDGLEYLILENDFKSVVKFIEQTNDSIMVSDSRLIFNIDSNIFEPKEYHLLKRWMKPLKEEI